MDAGHATAGVGDGRVEAAPLGRLASVNGVVATLKLVEDDPRVVDPRTPGPEVGAVLRIETPSTICYGMVAGQTALGPDGWRADLELFGESVRGPDGCAERFRHGISIYPSLGAAVERASHEDLACIYRVDEDFTITVGEMHLDRSLPARLRVNDLLSKHFAIVGATGSGKSCTVALVTSRLLDRAPHAHVVMLDAHGEYASAFPDRSYVFDADNFVLPYWMLTFEELVEVIFQDADATQDEITTLSDLIRQARAMRAAETPRGAPPPHRRAKDIAGFSQDAPYPYTWGVVLKLLEERMGSLDHQSQIAMYRRLRGRIDARLSDGRYAFMFDKRALDADIADVIGELFRVPVNDKPLSIISLLGLPSEVLSVIVSVICRLAFDFGRTTEGAAPVTIICEEAHKYIPSDPRAAFAPTRRAIARIAKEGRKYGVSIGVISQRPSELDATIFSQCNTLIALRLSNKVDQDMIRSALSDGGANLTRFLPSLVAGEAILFGDAVATPARVNLARLPDHSRPKSASADFETRWSTDSAGRDLVESMIQRLRRTRPIEQPAPVAPPPGRRRRAGDPAAALMAEAQPFGGRSGDQAARAPRPTADERRDGRVDAPHEIGPASLPRSPAIGDLSGL